MRDSPRVEEEGGKNRGKAVERTLQCELGKCVVAEEEEEEVEEVMPERLQTACLYLLRCVQSVGSLGGQSLAGNTANTSPRLKSGSCRRFRANIWLL